MISNPKFLLPENLNKLAKWLRALGYDALVCNKLSFHNMVRIANRDRRILLTRSVKQAKNKYRFRRRFIKSQNSIEQLKEISNLLEYKEQKLGKICLECNCELFPIEKNKIKNLVPEYIYDNHQDFYYCRSCGRIYWRGTHFADIKEKLEKTFKQTNINER